MSAYPSTIPAPTLDGYGLDPVDGVIRSDIGGGLRRARRQTVAAHTLVAVRWAFTQAEFAVFEAWHALQALDGAAWFTVALRNGQGATTYTARFERAWEAAAVNGPARWIVNAVLRVRSRPLAA